jgi:hypothetical protein
MITSDDLTSGHPDLLPETVQNSPVTECLGYSENCQCPRCKGLSAKCSRGGCGNRRLEGGDFCLSCVASRRSAVGARSTCDNLVAVPDPSDSGAPTS